MADLKEFNSSLETTRYWIDDLMRTLEMDEERACRALRVTLQSLRDYLSIEEAADLSAQLPLLLRGIFFEGWRPGKDPIKRSMENFVNKVYQSLNETTHMGEAKHIVEKVFKFLNSKVSQGQIRDITNSLPKHLRKLWPNASELRQTAM